MKAALTNFSMHDGSRHFVSLPEVCSFESLRRHVANLAGATMTNYLSDEVTEGWLDFSFRGHAFTINNQYVEFWFFVSDPACPDNILAAVVEHFESLLSP